MRRCETMTTEPTPEIRPPRVDRADFEPVGKTAEPKGRGGLKPFLVLAFLTLFGAGAGYVYLGDGIGRSGRTAADGIPVIRAEETPIKRRPEDPGGMAIPDRDKLVYERLKGTETPPKVERLLPGPEEPQTPPMSGGGSDFSKPVGTEGASRMPEPVEPKEIAKEAPIVETPGTGDAAKSDGAKGDRMAGTSKSTPASDPTPAEVGNIVKPPVASVAPPVARFATRGPAYRVQLVAVRSEERARAVWRGLVKKHDDLLGSLRHDVVRADLGGKGVYYRLRAGLFADKDAANFLCAKLKALKVGCITVKAGS